MILTLFLSVLLINTDTSSDTYHAATSYTNAKEFYNSTGLTTPYHAELINGSIYYSTRGKLAKSSTRLRYATVGFDITMSTDEYTVSFQVQKNESRYVKYLPAVRDEKYEYELYVIDEKKLYELAELVSDKATVEAMMSNASIKVRIDAIVTTRREDKFYGSVQENGLGTLEESGTLYHLKNENEWESLKERFSGHDFASYRKIEEKLVNYSLSLRYNVGSNVTTSDDFSVKSEFLFKNGGIYSNQYRVLQQFCLPDVGKAGIDLYKMGYHLPDDEEWKTADGRTFSDSKLIMPKDIAPAVGFGNESEIMYANWQRNEYYAVYHPAGGSGTVPKSTFYYDNEETEYLAENTFYRNGYTLPEGKEWIDAEGNTYASGQSIHNWTSEHKKEIVLYANWQPVVVLIQTDQRGGSNGTDAFYEKFDIGFALNNSFVSLIDFIRIPQKVGYNFLGYYGNIFGAGDAIVGNDGKIHVSPNFFNKDSIIYAQYEAQPFKITFDKQGGYAGSNEVTATYGEVLPSADAPVRTGYTFKGYYTEEDGKGERYYNEFMAPLSLDGEEVVYDKLEDTILYAYWIDESAPELYFVATTTEWTNRKITLTATTLEYGVGLSSLTIYQGDTPVAASTDLNGANSCVLDYVNEIEGITNYRAVAVDMNGNTLEAYLTTKYDITPPSGEILDFVIDENGVTIIVNVTDINTGE